MAVNENDRVSTRRLKEFWQTAKPWIQTLVSGSINTSEETMRSTMDTKILAAKPDYTKPNINGQIGDGFGYNDMVGCYKTISGGIAASSFSNLFAYNATSAPFEGNAIVVAQLNYAKNISSDSPYYDNYFKHVFECFEGKLVAIGSDMVNDPGWVSYADFVSNLDNLKSTFDPTDNSLISPPIKIGENTYQTKIFKPSLATEIYYSISINGSEYSSMKRFTTNTAIAWCVGYNNMPMDIGSCDVPASSINSTKLANQSVTTDKIQQSAVTYDKIANCPKQLMPRINQRFNNTTNWIYLFLSTDYANGMAVEGLQFEGSYSTLTDQTQTRYLEETIDNGVVNGLSYSKNFIGKDFFTNQRDNFGWCSLKTDIGYYFTPVRLNRNNADNLFIYYLDPSFASHLSETNAYLICSCPPTPSYTSG